MISPSQEAANPVHQVGAYLNIWRKPCQESRRQLIPPRSDQIQPFNGEALHSPGGAAFQDITHLPVISSLGRCCDIGIKGEGRDLTQKDLFGCEEDPRWAHLARQHRSRILPELKVVGPRIGEDYVQGIPVAPPAPAHALDVIRLLRGHRAQKQGREVADVDPHLKGRGRGNKVRGPPCLAVDEPGLDPQPLIGFEDTSMLARDHPVVPVRLKGSAQSWARRHARHHKMPGTADLGAGGSRREGLILREGRLLPTTAVTGEPDRPGRDRYLVRVDQPGVPVLPFRTIDAAQDAVRLETLQNHRVDRIRFSSIAEIFLTERPEKPVPIPTYPLRFRDALEPDRRVS